MSVCTRAEAGIREGHEGAVYGRVHSKYPDWYIDTAGDYQWQIITKTSETEMDVLIRDRTLHMREIGCNGCTARHTKSRKHCLANKPVKLSADQQTFADACLNLKPRDRALGIYSLYEIGEKRAQYPGKWRFSAVSGIFEDGYKSGQATVTLADAY